MAKTPIAIPNITVNGDDYWDSHKSQYNALIGGDVEPIKIDLSGWNTSEEPLYAWVDSEYDNVYYYTLSETPSSGDVLYNSDGSAMVNMWVDVVLENGFTVHSS